MPRTDVDRERLLAEYDALEDAIETSASAQTWTLADWLAAHVPNEGPGRPRTETRVSVSLADLAERRGRTVQHLRQLRRVAATTRALRLSGVSVRAYQKALETASWDLGAANIAIEERGPRLRDHGPMESAAATRRQVQQLPLEDRAAIAGEILADPAIQEETLERAALSDEGTRRGMERAGRIAERSHPAQRSRPPLGVPDPEATFMQQAAGPLTRLHDAVEAVETIWRNHSDDAESDDRESVHHDIAEYAARLSALIADWSIA